MRTRLVLSLGVVAMLACGCQNRTMSQGGEDGGDAPNPREADRKFAELLAGKDEDGDMAMEARQYLAPNQAKNRLWKTNREQTLKWVDTLYQAGAAKVYCIYNPADEQIKINMCASLLVELPNAAEPRAKVLQAFNRIEKQLWGSDSDRQKDAGQRFLYLNMDP